jgi:hypothetical protein
MKELAAVALPLTMAGLWRVDIIESSLNYWEGLLLSWRTRWFSRRRCSGIVRDENRSAVLT